VVSAWYKLFPCCLSASLAEAPSAPSVREVMVKSVSQNQLEEFVSSIKLRKSKTKLYGKIEACSCIPLQTKA